MRKSAIIFIALFLALSLAPFVLMPWFGNQEAESADADVQLRPLFVDGHINRAFFLGADGKIDTSFIEQAGNYFSKKFAFRREMVDAGDRIKAAVFSTSGQSGVVTGRDGYLFYKDSFNNFLGRDQLSDYQIASLAYNLKLMQDELSGKDLRFLFTIAPNKNTLYPELMPKRYRPDRTSRNAERLIPLLKSSGVFYTDLFALFGEIDDVMYLRGDSHWNNKGAGMVSAKLMDALGREHEDYTDEHFTVNKDFKGDLYNMLYPAADVADEQIYYDKMAASEYNKRVSVSLIDDMTGEIRETNVQDNEEWSHSSEIYTENLTGKTGCLLMIRDSFGNSLTPFIADEFERAVFLNGTPYDLGKAEDCEADTVIFETVERNLDRIILDAPVLCTTDTALTASDRKEIKATVTADAAGKYNGSIKAELSDSEFDYTYISGDLDPELSGEDLRPYAVIRDTDTGRREIRALFRTARRSGGELPENNDETVSSEYGFAAYIKTDELPENCEITLVYGDGSGWHGTGVSTEYSKEF